MTAERIQIGTHDGDRFAADLALPKGGRGPGVVMIPEIFGVNEPIREAARLFADHGYVVLALDIFWRLERNVDLGYDKTSYEKAFALHRAFDYELGVADMNAAITTLKVMPACTGPVGVTGFCLGGTFAYLAAARSPIDMAAGYYGTRIQNFLVDGPRIRRPLLLHFGAKDHTTPPAIMAQILPAVRDNPNVTVHVYEEAGHAFANSLRPETYLPDVAALAHRRTFALFDRVSGLATAVAG